MCVTKSFDIEYLWVIWRLQCLILVFLNFLFKFIIYIIGDHLQIVLAAEGEGVWKYWLLIADAYLISRLCNFHTMCHYNFQTRTMFDRGEGYWISTHFYWRRYGHVHFKWGNVAKPKFRIFCFSGLIFSFLMIFG